MLCRRHDERSRRTRCPGVLADVRGACALSTPLSTGDRQRLTLRDCPGGNVNENRVYTLRAQSTVLVLHRLNTWHDACHFAQAGCERLVLDASDFDLAETVASVGGGGALQRGVRRCKYFGSSEPVTGIASDTRNEALDHRMLACCFDLESFGRPHSAFFGGVVEKQCETVLVDTGQHVGLAHGSA